mmetsp:Transcript_6665/g.16944  ORF Transcript_6665/g.16944 Transcript_6665/m.16944 type:complete len:128 (+) Transcript_6665:14-397(+)
MFDQLQRHRRRTCTSSSGGTSLLRPDAVSPPRPTPENGAMAEDDGALFEMNDLDPDPGLDRDPEPDPDLDEDDDLESPQHHQHVFGGGTNRGARLIRPRAAQWAQRSQAGMKPAHAHSWTQPRYGFR